MYLVHTGAQQYNDILEIKKEFQEIEKLKVLSFNNYTQYGGYGFRLYFLPSTLSSFFYSSSLFSELSCHIDIGEKLNVFNSFKGKETFSENRGKLIDFAGVILFLGSLLMLFYGYDFLRQKEYLKFLSSLYGPARSFICIVGSHIILLSFYFILITGSAAILLKVEVENIPEIKYIFDFVIVMLLMLIFFFIIGTIIGISKSKYARFFIIGVWVGSVYFIPAALNKIIEVKAGASTSNYQLELKKLVALMDFESRADKEFAEARRKAKTDKEKINLEESIRDILESYLDKEFKKIQNFDSRVESEIVPLIRNFQTFSLFFPSTFYLSVNNEISSRGYQGVMKFYRYGQKTKKEFVEFYTDKRAKELIARLKKNPLPKVESFIKVDKEQNIFKSKSVLPGSFGWGIFLTVLWIAGLSRLSYFLYKKSLGSLPKEKPLELKDFEVEINKGESNVVLSSGKAIGIHLYNVLSGRNKGFTGKVVFNGVNIAEKKQKIDFVYLCHPEEIPWAIKVKHFVSFIGRSLKIPKKKLKEIKDELNLKEIGGKNFNELTVEERGKVFFETVELKRSNVYMIDGFARGMPADFIEEFIDRLEELKLDGAAILYLTNDISLARKIGDYVTFLKKDPLTPINL